MAQGTFAKCPKCGARVKKENLRRHINSVHGEGLRAEKKTTVREASRRTVTFPWRAFLALAIAAGVALAGYWLLTRPQGSGSTPPQQNAIADVVIANFGTIRIQLDLVHAPRTAGNFRDLADRGFYDGLQFHRIAWGQNPSTSIYVIQGGDPNGDGTGGSGSTITWESTGLRNTLHTIAMARGNDPNSASSQFFINLRDNPSLDAAPYPYAVFGTVICGHDVVSRLGTLYPTGQATYDGRPTQTVTIASVTIVG